MLGTLFAIFDGHFGDFSDAGKWIDEVRQERGEDVIVALVGNKTDLAEKRRVSREEGEAYAAQQKILFVETSAKAGLNIKALFRQLAQQLPGADSAVPAQPQEGEAVNVKLDAPAPGAGSTGACSC